MLGGDFSHGGHGYKDAEKEEGGDKTGGGKVEREEER